MRPSEQRKQAYWIWQEYARSSSLAYLEDAVREDPSLLQPALAWNSLLDYAIDSGDTDAVQALVGLGADVNAPADGGYTYLHTAVEAKGNVAAILEILLNAGANPSAGSGGETALHRAALFGVVEAIPPLIAHGADVNARRTIDNQTTPLMDAAFGGHALAVHRLLEHRADPTLLDAVDIGGRSGGQTAREIAAQCNYPEVVEELDRWENSDTKR